MSSNFEADFIALSSRHVFSTPVDSAPNSVMIVNLFLTWLKFLSSRSSQQLENEMPRNQNKLLKGSPLFHMDEFEPEEWTFSGDHNETRDGKLPEGKGYLNFVAVDEVSAALGNAEVCFRQTCNKAVRSVNGTFRHGIIEGFADIVFVDNSRLMAVFEKGTLHGFAIEYNSEGRIVFIGHYENGKRTWDRSWLIDHNFNVACYNNKALIHFHKEDVFALQGAMERGLLVDQEDPEVKRVEAVDFEEYGYFMTLNFAIFGEKQMEEGYKLRFAPNLREDTEKFKVQAAWLVFTRLDSKTPRAAIKNLPLLQQFLANSGENVTRSFPKTLGSACAKFKTCKPCAQGSLRERYLACYPGSGSKWLGEVLSHAIGLAGYGCQGTTPSPEFVPEASILIKTHHQNPKRWKGSFSVMSKYKGKKWSRWSENLDFRLKDMARMFGRALLLIRNPYEAIISFWNHDRSGTYDSSSDYGILNLQDSLHTDKFIDFAKTEIVLWEEIYLDYLSAGTHLEVLHYEDMKEDIEREVRRIHEYLQIPVDETRLECAFMIPKERFKRKNLHYSDPFTTELHLMFESAMRNVQNMLIWRNLKPLPLEKYKWKRDHFQQ